MGTTNNWVKDGLDAYLSLTGEKRAQDKADSDKAYQQQSMQLAQNADQRAGAAAGLTNQLTQQGIDKGVRDVGEEKKYRDLYDQLYLDKQKEDPFTPDENTIKDPQKVAFTRNLYTGNKQTAEYARKAVAGMGNVSIPFNKISTLAPSYVATTANHMFGPAAMKRSGQQSIDPTTGLPGTITGNVGHINLEKGPDGEVYISADMEVKNADGSIRYAPFTNRTDDPNQPVKRMPISALDHEADTTLRGLDEALTTGKDPNETIARAKLAGSENIPLEYIKKIIEDKRAEDKNLKIRESDVAMTKKVSETLDNLQPELAKLDWSDARTSAVKLRSILGKSGMTSAEVDKAEKAVLSSKLPKDVKFTAVSTGDGVFMVDDNNPKNKFKIGSPTRVANSGGGDGSLTQKQKSELTRLDHEYSRLSISYDAAAKRLVDNPGEQVRLDKITAEMAENKRRTDEVLERKSPASSGMDNKTKKTAADFDGGNNKPSAYPRTGTEQIYSLSGAH